MHRRDFDRDAFFADFFFKVRNMMTTQAGGGGGGRVCWQADENNPEPLLDVVQQYPTEVIAAVSRFHKFCFAGPAINSSDKSQCMLRAKAAWFIKVRMCFPKPAWLGFFAVLRLRAGIR